MPRFYLETGYFSGDTGFRKVAPDLEVSSLEGYAHFTPAAPCPGGFYLEPVRACYYDPFYGNRRAYRVRVEGEAGELATFLQNFK